MVAKMTIKLPEELRRRAKAVAALRGETVSEVMRAALAEYVAEVMEEADDVRAVTDIEARIAEGVERVTDWDEADLDDLPA
ncbi:MAG: ribbon-helix-helix protein, CopG family [Anaerolineae bacterium]|nr:ribbon-helix-helix protein, CopG family [Anaerolineae bacterium]